MKPSETKVHSLENLKKMGDAMSHKEKQEFLTESLSTAGIAMWSAFGALGCKAFISGKIIAPNESGDEFTIMFVKNLEKTPSE